MHRVYFLTQMPDKMGRFVAHLRFTIELRKQFLEEKILGNVQKKVREPLFSALDDDTCNTYLPSTNLYVLFGATTFVLRVCRIQ